MISSFIKFVEPSERVNVIVAVSPADNALSLEVIVMPGTPVSTASVSDPEVFSFPAASVNLSPVTLINPLAVLLSAGINVAV